MTAVPLASVLGGPLSGALLNLNGVAGLRGWQWLFLAEGLPSILLGVFTLLYLTDRPGQATWLLPREREWLAERLRREQAHREQHFDFTLWQAFAHPGILLLCTIYFTTTLCNYGLNFWIPLILKSRSGWSNLLISTVGMTPSLVGAIGMLIAGAHSDRTSERRRHLACAAGVGALGFVVSGWAHSPVLTLVGFSLAALGVLSMLGPFWALSTCTMSGAAAAGAIAYINSVGNLGGFVGPTLMGSFKGSTGTFAAGLYTLAGGLLLGGLLALVARHDPALDRSTAAVGEPSAA